MALDRHEQIEVKTLRCHDVGYLLTIISRLVAYEGLREPVKGVLYSGGSHEEVIKEARELLFSNAYAMEMEKRYQDQEAARARAAA